MDKPFKTIDEQLEILKSRGMILTDENKTREYLLYHNYYNVINRHGRFLLAEDKQYVENCTFDEVLAIRHFDAEVKDILLRAILEVENYFKSVLTYVFSEIHKDEKQPYLVLNSYTPAKDAKKSKEIVEFIASMKKIIDKYSRHQSMNSIKHYCINHDDIPFWVFSDYMSFGQLVTMYYLLPVKNQNTIAKYFSLRAYNCLRISEESFKISPSDLYRIIGAIKDVRNILAHNNMIYYYTTRNSLPYFEEIHHTLGIEKTDARQSIYDVFVILQLFLDQNQYAIYYNSLRKRAIRLNRSIHSIKCDSILNAIGFPDGFYDFPKIEQPNNKNSSIISY